VNVDAQSKRHDQKFVRPIYISLSHLFNITIRYENLVVAQLQVYMTQDITPTVFLAHHDITDTL